MKKLLALVLALVMTLGLATVGTNAAYDDADAIDYGVAVDVLSAAGVLEGDGTGKFLPDVTLNRDAAAKIIAYLDLGKTVAESLPATQVFSDVPADHWASKYIAYGASAGYFAGDGTGKFLPSQPLTGYAFAKMLLCVLGYDAEIEEMVGNSWAVNVAKLMTAIDNNINGGVEKAASAVLTREEAAQYAFNTLLAPMVAYANKGTVITTDDISVRVGATPAAVVANWTNDYTGVVDGDLQLIEKLFPKLKLNTADVDDLGRALTKWENDGEVVSQTAASAAITYTAPVTAAKIRADLAAAGVKVASAAPYALTTATTAQTNGGAGAAVADVTNDILPLVTLGDTVEIYVDSAAKAIDRIVKIDYSTGTVTAVAANGSVTVDTAGTFTKANVVSDNALAKYDYITYAVAAGKLYAFPTTSVVGKETSHDSTTLTFAGTAYTRNPNAATAAEQATMDANSGSDDQELYLDQFGYALKKEDIEVDVDIAYAVVVATNAVATLDGATLQARLAFADGTTKDVTLTNAAATANTIYTYVVETNGAYTLTALAAADKTDAVSAVGNEILKKGRPTVSAGGTDITLYNNTPVVVETTTTSGNKFTLYTGYGAVPSLKDNTGANFPVKAAKSNGKTTFIFIDATGAAAGDVSTDSSSTILFYVLDTDATITGTGTSAVYAFPAVLNGAAANVAITATPAATVTAGGEGVYKSTSVNTAGNRTDAAAAVAGTDFWDVALTSAAQNATNGVFDGVAYGDNVLVALVATDGSVSAGTMADAAFATASEVIYTKNSAGTISTAIIFLK